MWAQQRKAKPYDVLAGTKHTKQTTLEARLGETRKVKQGEVSAAVNGKSTLYMYASFTNQWPALAC